MSLFDSNILLQVKSTVEQEREEFMRHKEMFRTDQDPARRIVHQKRKYSVSQASVDSVTDTQMILRHKTDTIYVCTLVWSTSCAFRTPRSGNM